AVPEDPRQPERQLPVAVAKVRIATAQAWALLNTRQDVAIVAGDVGRPEIAHRLLACEHPAAEPVRDQEEFASRLVESPRASETGDPPADDDGFQGRHRWECSLGDTSFSQALDFRVIPRPGSGQTRDRTQPPEIREAVRSG